MDTKKTGLALTKWDIGILAALVLLGIALTLWIYRPAPASGNFLEVRQEGRILKTLPLDRDHEETIIYKNGKSNTFVIKDKSVAMTEADCGDHTCIHTGTIDNAGETIVCLPHRLVLQIVQKAEKEDPDMPDAIVH